jgi:hypothetical protein
MKVTFGGVGATVMASTNSSTTATVPAQPEGKEGKVDVIVINTDDQKDTAKEGYEYKKEPDGQQSPPVSGGQQSPP